MLNVNCIILSLICGPFAVQISVWSHFYVSNVLLTCFISTICCSSCPGPITVLIIVSNLMLIFLQASYQFVSGLFDVLIVTWIIWVGELQIGLQDVVFLPF